MLLQLVALEFPRAILHFSSQIGRKPPQSEASASAKYKTTITVVPATADVDINRVCSRLTAALNVLGNAMHITPSTDLFCAAPGVQGAVRNLDEGRLARLLADLEERNHWLVYEAEAPGSKGVTDWTRRCVRQAGSGWAQEARLNMFRKVLAHILHHASVWRLAVRDRKQLP